MADPHLTHSDQERSFMANTMQGQFFWAGTRPAGASCDRCWHWVAVTKPASKTDIAYAKAQGLPIPKPTPTGEGECGKVTAKKRARFRGSAARACKYFAQPTSTP